MRIRLIGLGRAGSSLQIALTRAGFDLTEPLGSGDDPTDAASGVDLVVLAVGDDAIAEVAGRIAPGPASVIHLSGATTLEPLADHRRRGSIHPLVSLVGGEVGAEALRGAAFAIASFDRTTERRCRELVASLGGTAFTVDDRHRAAYHATAAVAANHLAALCGQVERLAGAAELPPEVFWPLMTGVLDRVTTSGARAALTGPVVRGDWHTVRRHLDAIAVEEQPLYLALAAAAARLVDTEIPSDLTLEHSPDADS